MRETELLGSLVTLAIWAKLTPLGEATTTLRTAKALVTARTGEVTMADEGKWGVFALLPNRWMYRQSECTINTERNEGVRGWLLKIR